MTDNQKIKINITCWHFPKWHETGHAHGKFQRIELEIKEFRSLLTLTKREPPYINTYLLLNGNRLQDLYDDLLNLILTKFMNVSTIDMNTCSQKIYTTDLLKETGDLNKIFDIPANKNNAEVHSKKEYLKYFNRNLFTEVSKEKKPFKSEYIGYTGRTKEELLKGVELRCELFFENSSTCKIEYIYIKGLSVLKKKWSTGPISAYYIIPKDLIKQANVEFERVLNNRHNVKEIKVGCKLFDDSIRAFNERTNDNVLFERHIEYYYYLHYKTDTGSELIKQFKEIYDSVASVQLSP